MFSHEKELACSGESRGVDPPTEEAPEVAPPIDTFAWKRVRANIATWRAIGAKPSILSVIEYGVPLEWGPEGKTKPFDHGESMENGTEDEKLLIDEEVRSLIRVGAVKVSVFAPKYVSRLFLVEKADGGRRAVIDLSHLNKSIREYPMTMQTLHFVAKIAQPTDWMLSCDVKNGYYHLAIREDDQRFLQFRWRGVVYQYMGLPMGYSLAPYWFCTLMFAWVRYVQTQWMVRILSYIDDFLFFFTTAVHARDTREKIELFFSAGAVLPEGFRGSDEANAGGLRDSSHTASPTTKYVMVPVSPATKTWKETTKEIGGKYGVDKIAEVVTSLLVSGRAETTNERISAT